MSHPPDTPPSRPGLMAWLRRPRRFRLSVRAVLVTVLLLALALAWPVNRAHTQRAAVLAIRQTGGQAYYDWQCTRDGHPRSAAERRFPHWMNDYCAPETAVWVLDWIGPDYFGNVVSVTLGADAGAAEMAHVARLHHLVRFQSGSRRIGPDQVVHLAGLTDLQEVGMTLDPAVAAAPMADLSRLTKLESLLLSGYSLRDADLAALRRLTGLQDLWIDGPMITDAGLAHLAGLVGLREFSLDHAQVTSAGLIHLRGLRNLSNLRLTHTRVADLTPLADLPQLASLWLADNPITDAGLAPVARIPRLSDLSLNGSAITDAGLATLRLHPSFFQYNHLDLARNRITDASMAALVDLPFVASLRLDRTEITDAGLAVLARGPHFVNLSVAHTAITDAGLDYLDAYLKPAPALHHLDVSGTAVTPARVARLRQARPRVGIDH